MIILIVLNVLAIYCTYVHIIIISTINTVSYKYTVVVQYNDLLIHSILR